jgi:hypothetical protein
MKMTNDRREWKNKTCCAYRAYWDKQMMMMMMIGVFSTNFRAYKKADADKLFSNPIEYNNVRNV